MQQIELEQPKLRGRPRLRRASTMSLGVDEDEAFSTAEDDAAAAAAAMSGLAGGGLSRTDHAVSDGLSATFSFGNSDEEGGDY
eukprot:COSAG02_NODE_25369_length_660_cov_1.620321_1_plen_83_part_00